MKNVLTKKLLAVIDLVEDGLYQDALDKLTNDILNKTNGCAVNNEPDRNDWITSCSEQTTVYQQIIEAIAILDELA